MKANPRDARAPYYLGNLLYDWQPEEAVKLWEASAALDPSFADRASQSGDRLLHQKSGSDLDKAIASLEKAVSLERKYALHFTELDELYEQAAGAAHRETASAARDRIRASSRSATTRMNREIGLKVASGKYDEAIQIMTGRRFAVAEGANLNVADQWMDAHLLRGRKNIDARRYKEALADFQAAVQVPANIPTENVTLGGRSAEIAYLTGVAYEGLGDKQSVMQSYTKGSAPVESAPSRRGMGADAMAGSPESYYQALCLQKLGQADKAKAIFQSLVDSGLRAVQQQASGGGSTFGVAAGRRAPSPRARLASAHYLSGLGYLGLNDQQKAKQALTQALQASPDLLGARTALAALR